MGRYTETDRERSQERIARAQKKHENTLKNKRELYSKDVILALPFDSRQYGERIRHLRVAKGLTTTELAAEIGTTAATLSKMENGTIKRLNMDFLYLLCAVFDTSPHYLLGIASDPNVVPQKDESGNTRNLTSPIKYREELPARLSVILSKLAGVTDDAFQNDPDLCEVLLFILEHRDPNVRLRLKDAIRGICAVCLPPDEFKKLNGVEDWKI